MPCSIAPAVGIPALIVDGPVDLDDDLGSRAVEIGDERPDRMLFSEPELTPAEAQETPEQHFGKAELAS